MLCTAWLTGRMRAAPDAVARARPTRRERVLAVRAGWQLRAWMRRGSLLASVAIVAGLAAPAPSIAAVSVGDRSIVVSGSGAAAIIVRDPFRMEFVDAAGAGVLSEVANARSGPRLLRPTVDPRPPGVDRQSSGLLLAPLAFLVGRESFAQYPGLVWGGDLFSGLQFGVQYSARRVTDVRVMGAGVRLTVSTDDPSKRTLVVDVVPAGGAIRVSVLPRPADGVAMMSDSFVSSSREAFYGFGGRHNALDQHGRALSSFVEEEDLPAPRIGLFPGGLTAAYYPQAQFVSSDGYGFALEQTELSHFRLDSDRQGVWSVTVAAPALSYLVVPGAPARAIGLLTARSGRQPVPPRWALGPMFDREVKNFGDTPSVYQASVEQDIADIRRYRLPVSAYRIEGWGFPSADDDGFVIPTRVTPSFQAHAVMELRAIGIHPLAYLRPWIAPGSVPDQAGLTVRQANGQTYVMRSTLGAKIALLDFTNPAAVSFWQHELEKMFDLGFDGFMQDFGEQVLTSMHFADGETGITMHNRYLILYARATREAIDAYERSHPNRSLWFFNRAGYSGAPGSAAYEGANFPGDEVTGWDRAAGLASLAPDMLNRAIGGAYGYGTDIGGYYDYTTPPTTKELFLRWAEWAALSPIFRLHGSARAGVHTPWSYDQQTVASYRALSILHERAIPLIMSLWRQADATGIPPTRPLWLQFPGDPTAAAQQQEWTLGDNVLVAPVVTEGATSRHVYFPAGCWRAPQTGLVKRGPTTAIVPAPLTTLPYFFRCGTTPFHPPAARQ